MTMTLRRRAWVLLASCGGLVIGLSSFIHPFGDVKASKPRRPLLYAAQVDERTLTILEHSCQDCHSDRTSWPWYSYFAPASWLVERDVHNGRAAFNMSSWDGYTAERQKELLAQIAAQVRNKRMPQSSYTLLHKQAKLSDSDTAALYEWAHSERRRLRTLTASAASWDTQTR